MNGVKRAVTKPQRLIGLLFTAFWLIRFVFLPSRQERGFDMSRLNQVTASLSSTETLRILDSLVFGIFAMLTFFMMLGSLSTRNQFRPADVDVLFPTPVKPQHVLIFRIVRDYLVTLISPLFFILIGYRPAAAGIRSLKSMATNPEAIAQTMRLMTGVWLLVALCWVCISYAASLFVNRSDLASDRNRKIIGWSLTALVLALAGFISYRLTHLESWHDLVSMGESPFLRISFFTATLATWAIHGIVQGDPTFLLGGLLGLLGIIFISVKLASTQAGWMYDQAAARGFDSVNARRLQQSGDTIGLITEQARRGKLKLGRTRWIARRTVHGAAALLWKEAILMVRSTLFLILLFAGITMMLTFMPIFFSRRGDDSMPQFVYLIFQAMGTFICASALAQAGFIELLRRVDVQKPLPFPFSTSILYEVVAKALPATVTTWICTVITLIANPSFWQEALAAAIAAPLFAVLICATTCLVTIVFPDFEDPTQRGFRGMVNFFGVALVCAPTVILFATMLAFGISAIFPALISVALNVGIAALVLTMAGNQYAQFNPSE